MSIRSYSVGVVVAACTLGAFVYTREEPTRLTFLAVGQGDCAVLRHRGRTFLVDAGPALDRHDAGARIVLPRLREMGVSNVDLLFLTHPDLDHVGGAGAILDAYPNAQLAIAETFRNDPEMRKHLAGWKLPPGRIVWLPREGQMAVGDLRLRLHSPLPKNGKDANAGSLFLRIEQGAARAVLTGDAPREAERNALRLTDWSAQVLKAGHHGSRTSTDETFLRAVHPEWLIVSCGRDNRYGHPARETLMTAASQNVKIARTDREGDLSFEIRDGRFVRMP